MTDKDQKPPADQPSAPSGETAATQAEANAGTPGDSGTTDAAPAAGTRPPAGAGTKGAPARRKEKKSFGWLGAFIVLLLLGGLAGLGYYQWWEQQALEASLAELNGQLENQGSELQQLSASLDRVQQEARQAVQQAGERVEEGQQRAQQLQRELSEQNQQLEAQVRALRRQVQAISSTTTEDWKLAEAYYLTRLAGQRLLMERDTGSALALLQAADEIVRDYPDPDLYPARAALADDIAALRLANNVDRQGLYLRIAALNRQIRELPVGEALTFQREEEPEQAEAQTSEGAAEGNGQKEQSLWQSVRQSFRNALNKLTSFVRVTPRDVQRQPILTPDQQRYMASSLQTSLDTAQLALLREQPVIYESSLERARQLLDELYPQSRQRDTILAELRELESTDIRQGIPDIGESQQALSDYLEQRHRLAPQSDGGRESPRSDQDSESPQSGQGTPRQSGAQEPSERPSGPREASPNETQPQEAR